MYVLLTLRIAKGHKTCQFYDLLPLVMDRARKGKAMRHVFYKSTAQCIYCVLTCLEV